MVSFVLRTLLLIAALYGLWRLWGVTGRFAPVVRWTIGGGLFVRVAAGTVLFFISWFELPFARSMQLGEGFWFFGLDGTTYFRLAADAAGKSPAMILSITDTAPSVFYIRVLALFAWLFGVVSSVSILLNVIAYLATMLLIATWAERNGVRPLYAVIPLLAMSFLPASILWSLQPMKDSFFCLLIVLFPFALETFVSAMRVTPIAVRRAVPSALLLMVSTYGLAGIRWYYAVMAVIACGIALLAVPFTRGAGRIRIARTATIAVVFFLMTQMIIEGAGPYLPAEFHAVFRPLGSRAASARDRNVVEVVEAARNNFDSYQAAGTRIRAGSVVTEAEGRPPVVAAPALAAPAPAAPAPAAPAPAPARIAEKPQEPRPAGEKEHPSLAVVTAHASVSETASTHPPPPPQPTPHPPPLPAVEKPPVTAAPPAETAVPHPPAVNASQASVRTPDSEKTASAPAVSATQAPVPRRSSPAKTSVPPQTPSDTRVDPPPKAAPKATPNVAKREAASDFPTTAAGRIATGLAALLLPRAVGQRFGLVVIGGGRGVWWFAEVDTLLTDILLIVCGCLFFRSMRAGGWRDPMIWYLVVVTSAVMFALAYTVSNYGTLFRHRQMVVTTLVLIGLVAARVQPDAPRTVGAS